MYVILSIWPINRYPYNDSNPSARIAPDKIFLLKFTVEPVSMLLAFISHELRPLKGFTVGIEVCESTIALLLIGIMRLVIIVLNNFEESLTT